MSFCKLSWVVKPESKQALREYQKVIWSSTPLNSLHSFLLKQNKPKPLTLQHCRLKKVKQIHLSGCLLANFKHTHPEAEHLPPDPAASQIHSCTGRALSWATSEAEHTRGSLSSTERLPEQKKNSSTRGLVRSQMFSGLALNRPF